MDAVSPPQEHHVLLVCYGADQIVVFTRCRGLVPKFETIAAKLDLIVAEARARLELLGISLTDEGGRIGPDQGVGPRSWSWAFTRTMDLPPYRLRTTGRVTYREEYRDLPECWLADWRAEAWQGTGARVHGACGKTAIGPEIAIFGVFERLVLALLRRAAPAFPEIIADIAWPPFPELPTVPAAVDHIHEVRLYHQQMIEPWTGPPIGCPAAEVDALEARLGWRLPAAYRQYLLFMGADRQGVFMGCDWFIEHATVNTMCLELAYMDVDYIPHGDTFEFMCHHGYLHGWFDLPAASDDPPVHFYKESRQDNRVIDYTRFTDLLMAELRYMSYHTRRVRTRLIP